jgi:hypothetical protein
MLRRPVRDRHAADDRAIGDDAECRRGGVFKPLALALAREEALVSRRIKGSEELAISADESCDLVAVIRHQTTDEWHSFTLARRLSASVPTVFADPLTVP